MEAMFMKRDPHISSLLLAAVISLGVVTAQAAPKESYLRSEKVPAPENNQVTPERVELGRALFFDPRLSGSNWISCATCHNPALGWSDGLPTAIGHGMQILGRATPTILNTAYQRKQMWDGRFRTLEEQALGPIGAEEEMAGGKTEGGGAKNKTGFLFSAVFE